MKAITFSKILLLVVSLGALSSCEKCKECYLIEEFNGNVTETRTGEFCGDAIEEEESRTLSSVQGTCRIECR